MTADREPEEDPHVAVDPWAAEAARRPIDDAPDTIAPRSGPRRTFFVRKRTFYSLVFPVALLVVARPIPLWFLIGAAFLVAGQAMRLWGAGTLTKNEELATHGPYAHVRNPLYFGSLLMATGYCFMSGRWWAFIGLAVFYPLFYLTTIIEEERFLRVKFGDQFAEYCRNVPRLLIRITPWGIADPDTHFSFAQAQRNGEQASFLVSSTLTMAFALRHLFPMWW